MAFGIASWRGLTIGFTDGMCRGCAVRFRRQWKLPALPNQLVPIGARLRLAGAGAAMVVVAVLVLAARPVDEAGLPRTVTAPSQTVLVLPTVVGQRPSGSRPAPRASRRAPAATPSASVPEVVASVAVPDSDPTPFLADAMAKPVMTVAPASPLPLQPVSAPVVRRRFPGASAFASLPPASLTEQTP